MKCVKSGEFVCVKISRQSCKFDFAVCYEKLKHLPNLRGVFVFFKVTWAVTMRNFHPISFMDPPLPLFTEFGALKNGKKKITVEESLRATVHFVSINTKNVCQPNPVGFFTCAMLFYANF